MVLYVFFQHNYAILVVVKEKIVINQEVDIREDDIRENMPDILDVLLLDRTKSTATAPKNIIWANDNYKDQGSNGYAATAEIKPELITGDKARLIMPRALKSRELQKKRTKKQAEVFTPTWIVEKQNDAVDAEYQADDLETYTNRKWLEITCGEAPYMATRYEMETGTLVPLAERTGFVDRKLARINREVDDKAEWQRLVERAYKASYGFEWNGDSLLLARENLLYTYYDYYAEKWGGAPTYGLFKEIAEIISYNIFQMDGLTYTIPLSAVKEEVEDRQRYLFNMDVLLTTPQLSEQQAPLFVPGEIKSEPLPTDSDPRVMIMNWETLRMEFFCEALK